MKTTNGQQPLLWDGVEINPVALVRFALDDEIEADPFVLPCSLHGCDLHAVVDCVRDAGGSLDFSDEYYSAMIVDRSDRVVVHLPNIVDEATNPSRLSDRAREHVTRVLEQVWERERSRDLRSHGTFPPSAGAWIQRRYGNLFS